MDYSFLEISFSHYEAFGGPFFNNLIGGITQLFSINPSDWWMEFTGVFWMMAIIFFLYSMLSSWEVKQSFRYFYDWDMPWRNPIKKILFGNIFSRYLVALALMYTAFLPIPVVQMTPVVAHNQDGSSEIRSWVINDMKTSIDSAKDSKYGNYDAYKSTNRTTAHIPLLFVPISWFESFYYGFPDINEAKLFDKEEYKTTGKYLLNTDDRGSTLLSCLEDDSQRLDIINEQEVGIALKSKINLNINDFSCSDISDKESASAKAAKDGFAAVLFGLDVASDGYRDFFSPIDNIFEIIMINSFGSVIDQGVNWARTPSAGSIVDLANRQPIDTEMEGFKASLKDTHEKIDSTLERMIESLLQIKKHSVAVAMPEELVTLLFYVLEVQQQIVDSNGNFVDTLIWARNSNLSPPTTNLADSETKYGEIKKGILSAVSKFDEADDDSLNAAELRYMKSNLIKKTTEANFKQGLCGGEESCAADSGVYKVNIGKTNVNTLKTKMKNAFFESVEGKLGYEHDLAKNLSLGSGFSIGGDKTTAKLNYIADDTKSPATISIPMSQIPTQSTNLKIGIADYADEARRNAVYKYLDRTIISAKLTEAYISQIDERIQAFASSIDFSDKDVLSQKFQENPQNQIKYGIPDSQDTNIISNALFGYYGSQYFKTQNAKNRSTDSKFFNNFRAKSNVYLPIEAIRDGNGISKFDIVPGAHAKKLDLIGRILKNNIWNMSVTGGGHSKESLHFIIKLIDKAKEKAKNKGVKRQLDVFSKVFEDIIVGNIQRTSGSVSSSSTTASGSDNIAEDIGSLKTWFSYPDADGNYADEYNISKDYTALFEKDSIFFTEILDDKDKPTRSSGAFSGIEPENMTYATMGDYGVTKSFPDLTKYYNHKSVAVPWSFSTEGEGYYHERRISTVNALSGDNSRQRARAFKQSFLGMVLSMRPYVEVGGELNTNEAKIIFSSKYMGPLLEKYPDDQILANDDFIQVLSKIVNIEINKRNESFKVAEGKYLKLKDHMSHMVKYFTMEAKEKRDDAIKGALIELDYAAMDKHEDGRSMKFITLLFHYNWKLTTIVLNFIREFQNTVIAETTDTFVSKGYSFYPEFLIGSYHTVGPKIKQEATSSTMWKGFLVEQEATNLTQQAPIVMKKMVLPSGAVPPWSNNSTLFQDTTDTISGLLEAVGFGEVALAGVGLGIVSQTKGFKKVVEAVKGSKAVNTAAAVVKGPAAFAQKFIMPAIMVILGIIGYVFAITLSFIFILLRVIVLGIMSGLVGFFNATIVVPIVFFLRFSIYNPSGDSNSPLHNLISKLPEVSDTLVKAGKQLSVWIISMTVIFILIYVHTNIFYPYAKDLSFDVWLNSSTSNYLSSWGYSLSLILIAVVYYYLVTYTYHRLMKYMQTITTNSDSDLIKDAKDMMTKNSSMLGKLQKMSTGGDKSGFARKR